MSENGIEISLEFQNKSIIIEEHYTEQYTEHYHSCVRATQNFSDLQKRKE